MTREHQVMGLFTEENRAVEMIRKLKNASWEVQRVHSPIPSHRVNEVLELKKSNVGWFTLAGGILGFLSGFGLSIFTAGQWSLIVGGKPVVALIPFVIVGFEFTILFSVFGNIFGFLLLSRLPNLKNLRIYDPRCSGRHFAVVALCEAGQQERLADFFKQNDAEVKIFD